MHRRILHIVFCFALLATFCLLPQALRADDPTPIKKIAAVVTVYRPNSHADVIVSRLLATETLDGQGRRLPLKLVSLYTDQVPESDISRKLAAQYGFTIYDTVDGALTLGTDELAVDGVLLVAEHGKYPESEVGQTQFPKRRLWTEVTDVMEKSHRVVPVYSDKHLSDNWPDAQWIYRRTKELNIPLMAGSSLPTTWRYPEADVRRGAKLKEIVAVSYHTLDAYGFHALEMVQSLAERRAGGETGVKQVQCIEGDAVWEAGKQGVFDRQLLDAALSRLKDRPIPEGKRVEDLARNPLLCVIDYNDGLRANMLTLNGAVAEFASAWRYDSGEVGSTVFWLQDGHPYSHFANLLRGVERMMLTGKPSWPAERTLLTSGVLNALHISRHGGGKLLPTPYLDVRYQSKWDWQQPPPPPPITPRKK